MFPALALSCTLTCSAVILTEHPVAFDWHSYGYRLRRAMPQTVREAPEAFRAHYIAERVAHELCRLNVAPNYDVSGRTNAALRYGPENSTVGACGDTARALRLAFVGAGIPQANLKTAVVLKRRLDGSVPQDINADHAALVLLSSDGPILFDLWLEGRSEKTFARFALSRWKGVPLSAWVRQMHDEGYNAAYCQEHPEVPETSPFLLEQLLRKVMAE
jgi:hypothetical protein